MNLFDELAVIQDGHVTKTPLEVGLRCLVYIEGRVGPVMCEEARVELSKLIEAYVDGYGNRYRDEDQRCVGDLLYAFVNMGPSGFFRHVLEHARARGLVV